MYTPCQEEGQDGERNGYYKRRLEQNRLEERRDHLRKRKVTISRNGDKDNH